MEWIIVISLLILGSALIATEVLFIPGTTIVGIIGFCTSVYGIYCGYDLLGTDTGHILLLTTLILNSLCIYLAVKFKVWEIFSLKKETLGSIENSNTGNTLAINDKGITISDLRPMGSAEINNEIYEVSTYGEFVDSKTSIQIVAIENKKIIVQPLT